MIRHLLILHRSGSLLFSASYEKGIDCCSEEHKKHLSIIAKASLLSAFFTSVNQLANEFGGRLNHMNLENWEAFIYDKKGLTGVMLTNPDENSDKSKSLIKKIVSFFQIEFGETLLAWNGNVSQFQIFGEMLYNNGLVKSEIDIKELCETCLEGYAENVQTTQG